ncbi:MAG: CRTAC1 family protein [Planctomycetota bacterium]|jgi:hypothetical protein
MTRTPDDRHDAEYEELGPQDDAVIAVAFRRSLVVIAGLAAVVVGAVLLLRGGGPVEEQVIDRDPIAAPEKLTADTLELPSIPFRDITAEAGIDFTHENGARGEKLLPETMGGGAAFLDVDGDGDMDLLLVNAMRWPHELEAAAAAGDTVVPTPHRLYRNDGTGLFEDITVGSGLDAPACGFGPAVGDFDGDGHVDVFIACLGPDRLYRGDGTGRFTDVTGSAGVAGPEDGWSTSAGFLDYDRDGDLDLFVCRYVQWSREIDEAVNFTLNGVDRAYGPPKNFRGTHNVLFRNEGDGTFADVSAEAGIEVTNPATGEPMGKALAVCFADVDEDGWIDILVANDTVANFAFRNRGDGTFEELGAISGLAFDGMGQATGAMGMDVGDLAGDGRLCIGIGNFANEASSLYVQQPADRWQFADMSSLQGIGSPSRLRLSFGVLFLDADLDGRLDMLQANGHLEEEITEIQASQRYRQAAQLFWNAGPDAARRFVALPDDRLGDYARPLVGRAMASADIDGDGDEDILLTQPGEPAILLRNEQATGHRWLGVRIETAPSAAARGIAPGAFGAVVELVSDAGVQRRIVGPTRSYLAQVEPVPAFGLGAAERPSLVRVLWPDGSRTEHPIPEVDRVLVVRPSEDGRAD